MNDKYETLKEGLYTAYIDGSLASNIEYRPQFISNNYKEGKKVLSAIDDELLKCDKFQISVAFITAAGIEALLMTLKELEKKNIPGEILTTNYLMFSEPKALHTLNSLSNITLKMYDVESSGNAFHTKGYIFKKAEVYSIIIGSSNITEKALTVNKEWNTRIISTSEGEVAKDILSEFNEFWNSPFALDFDEFYDDYKKKFEIIKQQKKIAASVNPVDIRTFELKPNKMQVAFINNLYKIINAGENKALLISATGTGKTYASAFAMRDLKYDRVLFLVHREQLAKQSKKAYIDIFENTKTLGILGGGIREYDSDFVFATVQTLSKKEHLERYKPTDFDCIIMDEAHHSPANSYRIIMDYFKPKLWLGMTATPDKRDDDILENNVYELFDHQIAYEIRLQQAMEEDMLCPFHYFGITDLEFLGDSNNITINQLTSQERVKHIVNQASYYGYSGSRLKGLIFCSRREEAKSLSYALNETINPETGKNYRTIAIDSSTATSDREEAFDRLAMEEDDEQINGEPLDYIISVDILNEGIDIVEVNQVIMLRPTQSPIVFIQQLGRGLRKAEGKEFVVILDFIGNYNNNFMIPIALSGDRTYNQDSIRKYVISGCNIIPGASTVHFDEIAKEKIFSSIDRIRGMKSIIKESYITLKNKLGRVPYMIDFYENGEIDPLLIIQEYKTYPDFLVSMEGNKYSGELTDNEKTTLEYLSKTVLSGVRPFELEILQQLIYHSEIRYSEIRNVIEEKYNIQLSEEAFNKGIELLEGRFASKDTERTKYVDANALYIKEHVGRVASMLYRYKHATYYLHLNDIIKVGLQRFKDKYSTGFSDETPFVLYEKYTRRDVCMLMNCGKDMSATMFGMQRINNDVFIFVTYHKEKPNDDRNYVDGKPDYADAFEDSSLFRWDSMIGKGIDSSYVSDVKETERKHLFVKKSDAEKNFYYMGQFDIRDCKADKKMDNKGKEKDITKFIFKMHHPVREDILKYLQSYITVA
ncbi:PLD-like domain-containing protein [Pseudobutyrivibrio sp. YE44]|uniref:DUF3427 domain-containing protein n=1 Tax=Pseudobutyrivibrio sp. YE44 TaxID=1520802 RepID=UPI00087E1E65|nr:DEAD/DEAH box helicase [Pseudobutyrivibrio sp. YE44]SDB45369.1 PLD-like domain-containing protein [Pseudobutyrivibrio sp. YE44]